MSMNMPPMPMPPQIRTPVSLPGTCSLVEQLDKRVLIILQDGRHLVGFLRSFDQFTNFEKRGEEFKKLSKVYARKFL